MVEWCISLNLSHFVSKYSAFVHMLQYRAQSGIQNIDFLFLVNEIYNNHSHIYIYWLTINIYYNILQYKILHTR